MNVLDKIRNEQVKPERYEFNVGDTIKISVKIVEGDERNIKVTTPMDLKIAEMLLEEMK